MDDRALTKLFLSISAAVIAVACGWVWSSYYYGQRGLEAVIEERGSQLKRAYEADLAMHSEFVHEIAQYVANDVTVNQLFRVGAEALERGDEALAHRARTDLLAHVNSSWQRLNPDQTGRIMHFHLPPDTSFLRVHQPDKYGDDLTGIRITIAEVNRTLKPLTGFESGRYFHGIRAVAPVFADDDDGRSKHIGALEIGVTLRSVLQDLIRQTGANFAVLFDTDHIESRVLPEQLSQYRASHAVIEDQLLHWTSGVDDEELIQVLMHQNAARALGTTIYADWSRTLGISSFSLMEIARTDEGFGEHRVGTILSWFPVEDQMAALNERVIRTMFITVLLVAIIEFALYFGLMRERDLRMERTASMTDALSGISNRRHFDDVLDQEVRRAARSLMPMSVILCDIDHFKQYNDFYGHQVGDVCIQKVAKALSQTVQRAGDFVGRYGGEEFVIILPDTTRAAASAVAERLRAAVEDLQIAHERHPGSDVVTISLGVANGRVSSSDSGPALVAMADRALYRAKEQGRNRVCDETFRSEAPIEDKPLSLLYR